MRTEDIWWKRLSNPVNLADSIVDTLIENRSSVIVYRDVIPWKETFYTVIMEGIAQYNSSMRNSFHHIGENTAPEDFFMNKYCSREEQGKYWKPSGTKARFLSECKSSSLNKSHVFIDLAGSAAGWIRFIDEYSSYFAEDEEHGLFVVFTSDRNIKGTKYIDRYSYNDIISNFDALLLCMTILSERKYSIREKQYISEVAVSIAEEDIVLSGGLAEYGMELAKEPYYTVQSVLNENKIVCNPDSQKIKTSLWQAQVKVLFPVLEQYRCGLVSRYKEEINSFLFHSTNGTYKTNNPYELEIGELYHLCKNQHILTKAEFDILVKVRDARNALAHWDVIPYEKLTDLLTLNI